MTDEKKPEDKSLWEKTKSWVSENRVVAGAATGFAAGTVVPGVGNVVGAIVGAGVGYASSKEAEAKKPGK